MKIKTLLTSLLLLITGAGVDTVAQSAFNLGSQITSESSIVSGKAYVLRHGGKGTAMPYVVDNGTNYDVPNTQNSATEACIYFLISNGNGTWKIKNYYTGKYWGVPVANSNLLSTASEGSAGVWTLNFSGGVTYPTAPDSSNAIQGINRSSQKIYMTAGKGSGDANKIYIYELDVLTSPVNITSGWYQIKWVTLAGQTGTGYASDSDVAGKYVRNYATEVTVSTKKYPLYLDDAPTTIEENAASLVYVDFKETVSQNGKDLSGVHCSLRSANGHYIKTDGSASTTATDNYIILVSSGTPNISAISSGVSGTRYSLVPMGGDATPYIGQTAAGKFPNVNMYAVNPAYLGLEAWSVVIVGGADSDQVTYTGSDAYGLKSVYNGGTFFLNSGVTPSSSDFTYDDSENKTLIVDGEKHRIIVTPSETLLASDVAIIQGNETTGKGNTMQALLRLKITPTLASTPTALALTLTGVDQLSNVAIYRTTDDELAADATPVKISGDITPSGTLNIPLTTAVISDGETAYLWVTADVKSNATEWATIDAAVTGITYTNMIGETGNELDLTAIGNPTGEMRIFKQQTALWTSSHANTTYYRIPTMINTADGGIVALTDLRYDHPYDLGKNASNGVGTHKIDVVSRRSTDGGLTWQSEVTVAAGDGSTAAGYGYGDPAIVRDADGTLHCLMAAGSNSYTAGMLHMGYSKSTDNGTTWSAVTDIYSSIDKGGLSLQSAFTTGGKGVTFSNGRMAFAFLGKVSKTTNIYPLYSDDKGATWHVQPTVAYGGGDESKLEIMNDNSLLLSVRKGSYNGTALRAHNRTTGDASGDGIGSWGEDSNWGSEMNANGCNADILYYNRETENASRPDVIFHTLTKAYSTYRKDLRLYMSFDQGETWKEAFQLQPGYAAYSSMQKLANGDLAIIFEDGSIGNKDKQDCYAINYVVLSSEIINAKIDELYDELYDELNTVKIVYGTTGETTYGTLSGNTWTSNDTNNPISGLTLTKSDGEFNKFSSWLSHYNLAYKPATANTVSKLTLTAPDGYIIKSYSMLAAKSSADTHTYTLTTAKGTEFTPAYNSYTTIKVDDIYSKSTAISVTTTDAAKYIAIADFSVVLTPYYPVALNTVGDASYATLYLPFDVTTDENTKAYYINSVSGGYALLAEVANSEIAANTAVVLINESSNSATFNVASGLVQQISESSNMLKGTLTSMSLDLSDETSHYSLGKKDGTIGFYKFDKNGNYTITLGANKAYLDTSASSGVKGFLFSFDDENNIEEIVDSKSSNGKCYNLAGQRLSKPMKGINIVNGKKVVIK